MNDLFEIDIERGDMYRSWVFPELYRKERPARIENWPAEDRAAYCGGEYTEVR